MYNRMSRTYTVIVNDEWDAESDSFKPVSRQRTVTETETDRPATGALINQPPPRPQPPLVSHDIVDLDKIRDDREAARQEAMRRHPSNFKRMQAEKAVDEDARALLNEAFNNDALGVVLNIDGLHR